VSKGWGKGEGLGKGGRKRNEEEGTLEKGGRADHGTSQTHV